MSSRRRRACWVSRAMSTERSSIGGRDSARTTAPESAGSASSLSQASRSRTSVRWEYAGAPVRRTVVAHRAHQHTDLLGRHALLRHESLALRRHGLCLCALGAAAPEPDVSPALATQPLLDPLAPAGHHGTRRLEDALRGAVTLLEPDRQAVLVLALELL